MAQQSNVDVFKYHYRRGNEYLEGNVKLGEYDGKAIAEADRVDSLNKALLEFDKCLELVPDHWPTLFLKSIVCQALGDHVASLVFVEKALKLEPRNHVLFKQATLEAVHNNDMDKALEYSRRAIELKQDDPVLLGNLAMTLLMLGKDQESLKTIRHALKIDPDDRFNQQLLNTIESVGAGKKPRPTVESVFK